MTRITARNPSDARPLRVSRAEVPTAWTTIAEAPDFSVPDTSLTLPVRDPLDSGRGIRPGEVFFLTPLHCRNREGAAQWIEARLLSGAGDALLLHCVTVPAGDTVALPIQGQSLFKRDAESAGDRLQVRAQFAGGFDVVGAAQERPANEHIGVTE